MTYTVIRTVTYPGTVNTPDPGYRTTVVLSPDRRREYHFTSEPDGSNPRSIGTRPVGAPAFRRITATAAAKRGPDLEAALLAHLTLERARLTLETKLRALPTTMRSL